MLRWPAARPEERAILSEAGANDTCPPCSGRMCPATVTALPMASARFHYCQGTVSACSRSRAYSAPSRHGSITQRLIEINLSDIFYTAGYQRKTFEQPWKQVDPVTLNQFQPSPCHTGGRPAAQIFTTARQNARAPDATFGKKQGKSPARNSAISPGHAHALAWHCQTAR